MKKDKISVAVFGCSHWHTPLYLDCIKKHTVCGVTDPNPQIGNTFAQDLKCSYYSTPEELLKITRLILHSALHLTAKWHY